LILLLASALLLAIDASPIDEVDGNASARKPGRLPLRKLLGRRKLLTEEVCAQLATFWGLGDTHGPQQEEA